MKLLKLILILAILTSCGNPSNKTNKNNTNNRVEILGRDFPNSEIKSIEIIEIEHPMLGGTVETTTLSENQIENFLSDFDNLNKKGMFKCGAKYVIRLNFENDTLRLKTCGTLVANRTNDIYYESVNGKNIINEYLKSK